MILSSGVVEFNPFFPIFVITSFFLLLSRYIFIVFRLCLFASMNAFVMFFIVACAGKFIVVSTDLSVYLLKIDWIFMCEIGFMSFATTKMFFSVSGMLSIFFSEPSSIIILIRSWLKMFSSCIFSLNCLLKCRILFPFKIVWEYANA